MLRVPRNGCCEVFVILGSSLYCLEISSEGLGVGRLLGGLLEVRDGLIDGCSPEFDCIILSLESVSATAYDQDKAVKVPCQRSFAKRIYMVKP